MEKFDDLMSKNKEIDPQTIKEMFPDYQELYEKVIEMKKKKKKKKKKKE